MTTKEKAVHIAFQCLAGLILGLVWSGCVALMGFWGIGL